MLGLHIRPKSSPVVAGWFGLVFEGFWKVTSFPALEVLRALQGPFWRYRGRFWDPKWTRIGPKSGPKAAQKMIQKQIPEKDPEMTLKWPPQDGPPISKVTQTQP